MRLRTVGLSRAAGVPLVLGLLALLAGCGSHTPSATGGTGPSVSGTSAAVLSDSSDPASGSVSDTAGPEDPATASGPSSSSFVTVVPRTSAARSSSVSVPAAGLAACAAPYLKLSGRSAHGRSGHAGYVLIFTNTGQIACSMTGYPGLAILDSRGRQIIQAARTPSGYLGGVRNSKPPFPGVGLAPGGTASALLEGLVVDPKSSKGCPAEPALLSTPPATTGPIKLAAVTTICSQVLIHPVVSGTTGSKP